jgi:phosphate starvation-inducible PhoH-like protein
VSIQITLTNKLKHLLTLQHVTLIHKLSNSILKLEDQYLIITGGNMAVVQELIDQINSEDFVDHISSEEIQAMYELLDKQFPIRLAGLMRQIYTKTNTQKQYVKILHDKDIVFAHGAAGTGKTHIAIAFGLNALQMKKVDKLVLSRPAIEAGEKLGFLPGGLQDKLDPYLRPLYDELLIWLEQDILEKYISQNRIEIAPLAYMRGRTFKNSWIILDEAQNTSCNQMKMFLTRLGYGSKMVITGDTSQIDIPNQVKSGLEDAIKRLRHLDSIGFVHFDRKSIIRHPMIQKILDAYDNY